MTRHLPWLAGALILTACDSTPTFPPQSSTPAVPLGGLTTDIPAESAARPEYVTGASGAQSSLRALTAAPVIRVYQDEMPWFGANRAHTTLVTAVPSGLGKTLGSDYFIHPLSDLALGIPSGTTVVLITSNSEGSAAQAAAQSSAPAQAALAAFLEDGGKLIVDMGDNLSDGGFVAPGSVGTPDLVFPDPGDDATLTAQAAAHPMVLGPDGVAGGGDDLDNSNIDACCFVAHGNLETGITLLPDATPLMTAGFGGVQRAIFAEYCVGAGLVILDTDTKEFEGQQPTGAGAGILMRNLFSYALGPGTPCVLIVDLDIKPGSTVNPVNLNSKGVIPVAILSTADLDASTIDPLSVTFGPGAAHEAHGTGHPTDIDGDGDTDLVLHFLTQGSGLLAGATEACVDGSTFGGQPIHGCDVIRIVP